MYIRHKDMTMTIAAGNPSDPYPFGSEDRARMAFSARTEAVITAGALVLMVATAVNAISLYDVSAPLAALSVATASLALTMRTRWPFVVLAAVTVIDAAHLIAVVDAMEGSYDVAIAAIQPAPIATSIAALTAVMRRPARQSWPAVGVCAVVLGGAFALVTDGATPGFAVLVVNAVLLGAGIGAAVVASRERRGRVARETHAATERAVTEERIRIARELHDVLAHNLTLVNAQAGVAEYLLRTDPDAAAEALRGITANASDALDEVRATVGLLRYGDSEPASDGPFQPVPRLARLDALIGNFRSAGTAVTLAVAGERRAVAFQTDLAAYRIVQESLTNATKHAPGSPVDVDIRWHPSSLVVEVRNHAPTAAAAPAPGSGHGIIGMRERARSVGGALEAVRRADGTFQVRADLPTPPALTQEESA